MPRKKRILITGVAHYLGGELARRLEGRRDVDAIFGIDVEEPTVALGRTEFVHADTRHSVIAKLVRELKLDTVVHAAVIVNTGGSARSLHESNVIGTMNVIAACSGESSPVRQFVAKSSVAVYGVQPDDPSFLREEMAADRRPQSPVGRDLQELEQMVQDFAVRNRRVAVTVMRLGYVIGIKRPTALTRYFSLRIVPTTLGFDPRLQFLHEEDSVEALYQAIVKEKPGVFNVAGDGVVLLSQALAIAGRRSAPLQPPYLNPLSRVVGRLAGVSLPPHLMDFLNYGQVVDCEKLHRELDWRPRYSTKACLVDMTSRRLEPVTAAVTPTFREERELQRYLDRRARVKA